MDNPGSGDMRMAAFMGLGEGWKDIHESYEVTAYTSLHWTAGPHETRRECQRTTLQV